MRFKARNKSIHEWHRFYLLWPRFIKGEYIVFEWAERRWGLDYNVWTGDTVARWEYRI